MKKFKHKKTGLEATQVDDIHYEVKYWKSKIPAAIIEDSEDWEEVIQKDYEILSFINIYIDIDSIGVTSRRLNNGMHIFENDTIPREISEEDCLSDPELTIHSIKRLSDGEVFSVGDRVAQGVITEISLDKKTKIKDGELHSRMVPWLSVGEDSGVTLSYAKKVIEKKPLFVTEDGVQVFEGDTEVYDVYCNPDKIDLYRIIETKTPASDFAKLLKNNKFRKAFYNKEAAQEYIDLHKPKYSLKDVEDAGKGLWATTEITSKLKNLNK